MVTRTEELINKVGGFGWFQRRLFFILSYEFFFGSFCLMAMTFSTAEPPWRCTANSTTCTMNGTFKAGDDHYEHRCSIPRQDWEFAVDGNFDSIVTEWDLVCETAVYVSIVNSLLFLLSIGGNMVGSTLSDKFGRKKVSLPFYIFMLVASLASAFAKSYWVFAVFRSLVGFALGAFGSTAFVLVMEYIGVRYRSAVGIGIWSAWILGAFTLALLGYLIPSWRTLTIITCTPGLISIVFWWFTPESLRWLSMKGRTDELKDTFKKAAHINGRKLNDDELELLDKSGDREKEDKQRMGDIRDLFTTRKIACQTLVSWYAWLVSGMVYYGIMLSTPSIGGNMYLNFFISSLCEAVGMVMAVIGLDKFGRRRTIGVSLWVAGVATMSAALLTYYDDRSKGYLVGKILMAMVLGKFFITISFDGVYVHTSELFPTVVRNVAVGSSSSAARVGSALSAYIVYTKRVHPLMPFGIMAINAVVSGLLFRTLPETLNHAMPDTIKQVENVSSQDSGADINLKRHGDSDEEKSEIA